MVLRKKPAKKSCEAVNIRAKDTDSEEEEEEEEEQPSLSPPGSH